MYYLFAPSNAKIRATVSGALAFAGILVTGAGIWWTSAGRSTTGPERDSGPAARNESSLPLEILVSGDTSGWIVPCGCTANQSGGLLRRGTFVAQERKTHEVIVVDAGGAPAGTALYERLKFEAILDGERALFVAIHNLGGPEAALDPDELKRLAAETGVPFVSANLIDPSGRLIAEPCRLVTAAGRRILFIGVLSPKYASSHFRIRDPRSAILETLADRKGIYDSAIVLAYLPESELRDLAASLPEVDAVIGGPTGQSIAPIAIGPTLLASATNKGKFLIRLVPGADAAARWSGDVVEMTGTFSDDPEQAAILAAFRRELEERDVTAAESGLAPPLGEDLPPDYRIAGSQSCRDCHREDHRHWTDSQHAHAWTTLTEKAAQADSSCQKCHTTGFGMPGGFLSLARSQPSAAVGCESCHGPSQAHVAEPRKHTPFVAKDQCVRCHDRENSPQFELAAYWTKIKHGAPATASATSDPEVTPIHKPLTGAETSEGEQRP